MTSELERLAGTPRGKRLWEQERLILHVTEFLVQLMLEQNFTRSELDWRLGKTGEQG